jgi:hypothetical protein
MGLPTVSTVTREVRIGRCCARRPFSFPHPSRLVVRRAAVVRGSRCALAPHHDGRPSNHAGRDQRRASAPQPVAMHMAEAATKLRKLAAFSIQDMLFHSVCSSIHVPQGLPAGARAGGVRKKRNTPTKNPMTPHTRMMPVPISNPTAKRATQAAPRIAATQRAQARNKPAATTTETASLAIRAPI